jgi:hypothetical protein
LPISAPAPAPTRVPPTSFGPESDEHAATAAPSNATAMILETIGFPFAQRAKSIRDDPGSAISESPPGNQRCVPVTAS